MEDRQWKYKIRSGKMPVILTVIMFAVFGGLTAWLYSTNNGAFIFTGLFSAILLINIICISYLLSHISEARLSRMEKPCFLFTQFYRMHSHRSFDYS